MTMRGRIRLGLDRSLKSDIAGLPDTEAGRSTFVDEPVREGESGSEPQAGWLRLARSLHCVGSRLLYVHRRRMGEAAANEPPPSISERVGGFLWGMESRAKPQQANGGDTITRIEESVRQRLSLARRRR